ncbi:hypothetical protein BU14_0259s0023 [Porphyra umbilicalis]|uniref:Uncharacterized protein n=1 Tax=Porphyra umbilicalis TaxID=2786 RepID=A0A1X6P2B3_PORUM|nr:hypothetical protein BU14_0259s0023 [Porphyra umbilicalis]|eukprot:OSX74988.1 hypothetical protein BU14_0259s0023 [Porphyra umbilicalis]
MPGGGRPKAGPRTRAADVPRVVAARGRAPRQQGTAGVSHGGTACAPSARGVVGGRRPPAAPGRAARARGVGAHRRRGGRAGGSGGRAARPTRRGCHRPSVWGGGRRPERGERGGYVHGCLPAVGGATASAGRRAGARRLRLAARAGSGRAAKHHHAVAYVP